MKDYIALVKFIIGMLIFIKKKWRFFFSCSSIE